MLPVVSTLSTLVHFLLAMPVLLVAVIVARLLGNPVGGWPVVLLPLAILVQLPFTGGLVLAFSALNVHFKDVRDLLANLLTLAFFLTPILYPLDSIATVPLLQTVVAANPLTPFVRLYQDILFYGHVPEAALWLQAAGLALVAWAIGTWLFDRLSQTLVEAVLGPAVSGIRREGGARARRRRRRPEQELPAHGPGSSRARSRARC